MSFTSVMQNLAIGIASGIFSSVIVSVVFYILNEFQNELNKAQDMTYPLYGVVLMSRGDGIPKIINPIDIAKDYFNDACDNFSRFEPWKFKYELAEPMVKINELLCDGKYYGEDDTLNENTWQEFATEIEVQLNIIQNCDKNFTKCFIKRIFSNKIILVTLIIFIAVLIIA